MDFKVNDLNETLKKFLNKCPDINNLLRFCTENKCSDLYIKVGECPYISRYGSIYKIPSFELTLKLWNDWSKFAISSELNTRYVRQKMLDFSYVLPIEDGKNGYRYRVSAGFSVGKNIATFRMISQELPSFNNINFPNDVSDILYQISKRRNKITILAGPTGSGKSIIHNQKLKIKRFI